MWPIPVGPIAKYLLPRAAELYQKYFDERRYWPHAIEQLNGLPDKTGIFDPFLSSRQTATVEPWSRNGDLERFEAHVAKAAKSHLIVTGPSGAGKTIFFAQAVKSKYHPHFILIRRYHDFLSTLINAIPADEGQKMALEDGVKRYLQAARPIRLSQALQEREILLANDPALQALTRDIQTFVRKSMDGGETTLLVFDQIERFLLDIEYQSLHPQEGRFAYEIYFIIVVLQALRELPNVRTVFSIREDALYESVDFLSYSFISPSDADRTFHYMYFHGINTNNADQGVLADIRTKMESAAPAIPWTRLRQFLSIASRSMSNTFFIQLTGYLAQHFDSTDRRVRKIIEGGEPRDLLPLFFDQLLAGFRKRDSYGINYDVARLVMLTIAIENRSTGNPVSAARVSLLAHLPLDYVDPIVKYLVEIGVVQKDVAAQDDAVRLAHDILSDHIIQADGFIIREDLQKTIERLSERRVKHLRPVGEYGRVWAGAGRGDIGALAVVAFIVYGGIVSITSWLGSNITGLPVCDSLHNFWSAWLSRYVLVDQCSSMKWYYPPIYGVDCAWVSFIYKLDRGYFHHVFVEHKLAERLLRGASTSIAVIGSMLGILLSFVPALATVPITVGGIMMAALLIIIWMREDKQTLFAKRTFLWGLRIGLNMLFTGLLVLLLWFMVTPDQPYAEARAAMDHALPLAPAITAKNLTFWITALFLFWFWVHVQPEQQSEVSIATQLASRDAVRKKSAWSNSSP
jgi:hypothetical protein